MDRRYPLLNKVMFIGRLVRDCEVKHLESGTQITHFSIAIDGSGNRGTEAAFIDFSKLGDFNVAEYLKKGTQVFIEGHISQNRTVNEVGEKTTFTNYMCDRLQLLGSPRNAEDEGEVTQAIAGMPVLAKEEFVAVDASPEDFDIDDASYSEEPDFDPYDSVKPGARKHVHTGQIIKLLEGKYGPATEWGAKSSGIAGWICGRAGCDATGVHTVQELGAMLDKLPTDKTGALIEEIKRVLKVSRKS